MGGVLNAECTGLGRSKLAYGGLWMGTVCVSTLHTGRAAGLVWGSSLRTLSPQELCIYVCVRVQGRVGVGWKGYSSSQFLFNFIFCMEKRDTQAGTGNKEEEVGGKYHV